jgi:hypothetical protein
MIINILNRGGFDEFTRTITKSCFRWVEHQIVMVVDLGSNGQTGINASTLYKLREALGLEKKPIKIIEPFQMLGEVEEDLRQVLGIDGVGVWNNINMLGYANENWKPYKMDDGTPVLMGGRFECYKNQQGDTYAYPAGDRSASPSVKMPYGGSFFDSIERSPDFDEDNLTPFEDYKDDFAVVSDKQAKLWEQKAEELYKNTEYGIIGNLGGFGLGDVATVPDLH